MANKPIYTVRVGSIQLAIWENELKDNKGVIRSITIKKSYKVGDEYKDTTNFKISDAPMIQLALQQAYEFHYLKPEPDF